MKHECYPVSQMSQLREKTEPSTPSPPDWHAAYDENGVDRSLTRSFLGRTPTECLQLLDEMVDFAQSARVRKPVP